MRPLVQRWLVVCAVCVVALAAFLASEGAAWARQPLRLEVPNAPDAFYFKPRGKGQKPVLMYLHGRGGNPQEDCRKWAKVATEFGWVVCPQGPEDRGGGARAWSNGVKEGRDITDAVLGALRAKYKGRVNRKGNILMGFSEGAFVAQQVGLQDQGTWSRWLILAASDQYWAGDTAGALKAQHGRLRRVYLLTGENDGVVENTRRVGDTLKHARVPVKVRVVPGMGHEIPEDRMVTLYRRPLAWLSAAK